MVDDLTKDQIDEFKEAFALFDKDGDGTITDKELIRVMRGLGQNPTDVEVRAMIAEVDADGNGSIDFTDFLMLLSNKLHTEDIREEMKSAFRVFDRDNDGVLTASELRDVLSTQGHKISDDEVDDFVRAADRSGDGRIDYEEFVEFLSRGIDD